MVWSLRRVMIAEALCPSPLVTYICLLARNFKGFAGL
jgi:hypothetical protein